MPHNIEHDILRNNIEYLGKLQVHEKIDFYESIDCFILPSISLDNDQDGIPVVLMEAVSAGLPIISTSVSGIPEICINDFNGFLLEEKNSDQIVKAIETLEKDSDLRDKFGRNSLKISDEYDIQINTSTKLKMMKWMKN